MRVGHELGSLLLSVVRLQEDIQHAHSHPGERHKVGEGLPHASCGGGTTAQAGQGAARVSPPSPKSSSQGQSPAAVLFSRPEARPATPVPVPEPSSPWAPLDIDRLSCSRELPSRPETRDPAAAAIFNLDSPAAPEAEIESWLWRGGGGEGNHNLKRKFLLGGTFSAEAAHCSLEARSCGSQREHALSTPVCIIWFLRSAPR